MTTLAPRRPRRVVLVLAIVLGILGMHALMSHAGHGGQDTASMAGIGDMSGMGHSMTVEAAATTGHAEHAGQVVLGSAADTHGMSAGFMVCALMVAGGLVVALARRRGLALLLRRSLVVGSGAVAREPRGRGWWPPPGVGPPPAVWRFSVVRC